MARTHARVLCAIWNDDDWLALDMGPQWLYQRILEDSALNKAGVIGLTPKRWARGARDVSMLDVEKFLGQLDVARFVVVDEDTEELLVRSFIRNDGIADQPNMLKAALNDASHVTSPLVRRVLAEELRRLPPKREDTARMRYPDPHAVAEAIDPGPVAPPPGNPSGKASPNPSGKASDIPSEPQVGDPSALFPQTLPETLPGSLGERSRGRGRGRGSSKSPEDLNATSINTHPLASLAATVDDPATVTPQHTADNASTSGTVTNVTPVTPRSDAEPDGFAAFYDAYPRRKDRRAAVKAFRAAMKRGATPDLLLTAAHRYAEQTRHVEARYVKYPASWLNAGAYDDGPDAPRLAVVRAGYQPYRNPVDASAYDAPLLPAPTSEDR